MNLLKKTYLLIAGLISFIVFIITLAPSVIQIDSGELATVQINLGIAHPTGYPLFTMLGYLFNSLPLPFSGIFKTNLLAALWCSLAIIMFVLTSKMILQNIDSFQIKKSLISKADKKKKRQDKKQIIKPEPVEPVLSDIMIYLPALAGGLILAFSKTFWFQSTSVEVYSLQVFLNVTIIFFIIKAFIYNDEDKKKGLLNWLMVAIVLAFGFSNHMTTLFIAPGLIYLYFNKYKFNSASLKRIFMMLLVFFPVLILIYSYLPIRASQSPEMNWGNPVDLERILRHVSGFQYQSWLFSSFDSAKKQFNYFVNNFPSEFNIALIIIAIGIYEMFRLTKKMFLFTIITFAFTILYSINYDIADIDSYFLLAYVSTGLFAVFGVLKLFEILRDHHLHYTLPISLLAIFIFFQAYITHDKVDQHDVYTFEDYTKSILQTSDKDAVIFSYQWDFFISASYYFRQVENIRKDVCIIDKELLRRSWYPVQLKRTYPAVIAGIQPTLEQFLIALKPFEQSKMFDANLLETLYRKIMTDLVATNADKRTYYIGAELFENEMQRGEFSLPTGYYLVPDLFFFKVVKTQDYVPAKDPVYSIRFPKKRDTYIDFIERVCGSMLVRRALYEMQFDKIDRAKIYIMKLQKDFPAYPIPKGLAEVIEK